LACSNQSRSPNALIHSRDGGLALIRNLASWIHDASYYASCESFCHNRPRDHHGHRHDAYRACRDHRDRGDRRGRRIQPVRRTRTACTCDQIRGRHDDRRDALCHIRNRDRREQSRGNDRNFGAMACTVSNDWDMSRSCNPCNK